HCICTRVLQPDKETDMPNGPTIPPPGRITEPTVHGIGPDAPVVVNSQGGRQSRLAFRSDLLPASAIIDVARVLEEGAAKYGKDNWRQIPRVDHLNHAM